MLVTLVALLCHAAAATPACFEERVADSDTIPGLTFERCQVGAQMALAQWKAGSAYGDDYAISRYECRRGPYTPKLPA